MIKTAKLFHNPGAGEGGPSKEELISMVESAGFKCSYQSVKEEGWRNKGIGPADFLIAAGGDGTVKKTVSFILENDLLDQRLPIALLPAGTANNIASALGVSGRQAEIIRSWKTATSRKYDLSMITGLEDGRFFIEGAGYGLFPHMVKQLKEKKARCWGNEYPEGKLTTALKELLEVTSTYPASHYQLTVDGKQYEGDFLMVEVMNIPAIGPNLNLAPAADSGDGNFDIVIVTEEQRDEFAGYVSAKLAGKEVVPSFSPFRANRVEIFSEDRLIHVDDEMIELNEPVKLEAAIVNKPLVFLT